MPTHPSKRRKKLHITDDEFFTHCMMVLGPPRGAEIMGYIATRKNFRQSGPHPYLAETAWGQRFVYVLTEFGEAKMRAVKWLYAYIRWWERLQMAERRKENLDASKDRLNARPGYW